MNKKQFKVFEKACKNEWKRLAKVGGLHKTHKMLNLYAHGCPACEISKLTNDANQ